MSDVMNISRDWKLGMRLFATVGYDYDAPNPLAPWVVTTGHTASGKPMDRTDEEMIIDSVRHFATQHEASEWLHTNHYH